MTRHQNLAAAAASFAIAIAAAAGTVAVPAGAGGMDRMQPMMGGATDMGEHEAMHAEMHELCHRMMMVMYELTVEGVALVNAVLGAEALVR